MKVTFWGLVGSSRVFSPEMMTGGPGEAEGLALTELRKSCKEQRLVEARIGNDCSVFWFE